MSETESTTRITRIGTVVLPVGDQDEALEFYVGTLGFEKRMDGSFGDGQRWIEVAPPGAATTIALVPKGASAGVEVSFATDDAEADHSAMGEGGRCRCGADPHGRRRAADVHVPRPRRQPVPHGRARVTARRVATHP